MAAADAFAEQRPLIGRVEIGRGRIELGSAAVDPLEHRPNPEPTTWAEVARWCRENERGHLAAHERKFVQDMAARLVCGGTPTEKQGAWLRALYAKLKAAAA